MAEKTAQETHTTFELERSKMEAVSRAAHKLLNSEYPKLHDDEVDPAFIMAELKRIDPELDAETVESWVWSWMSACSKT